MKCFFAIFFSASFLFLAIFGVNCIYGYLFPIKYQEEIAEACFEHDVDEAIIYSVINVESHFNKNAISSKGAVGLMQVMPSTAEGLAKEISLKEFDLQNPADNIFLGTYYIGKLLQRFDILETALAAYNAGPTNVSNWLKNADYSDDGKVFKYIPFEETRNYISKFEKNYKYYKAKL